MVLRRIGAPSVQQGKSPGLSSMSLRSMDQWSRCVDNTSRPRWASSNTVRLVSHHWAPAARRSWTRPLASSAAARLGISRSVLDQRLTRLVDQGILTRVPYQEHPPRHEYRLTDKGRDLRPVVTAMRQWGETWAAPDGPTVEIVRVACDHITEVVPTCRTAAKPSTPEPSEPCPGPAARSRR